MVVRYHNTAIQEEVDFSTVRLLYKDEYMANIYTVWYGRTKVIGSRTSFVISFVRSSIH
jgi:hypothetical protein